MQAKEKEAKFLPERATPSQGYRGVGEGLSPSCWSLSSWACIWHCQVETFGQCCYLQNTSKINKNKNLKSQ